jgi:hypothetical protein
MAYSIKKQPDGDLSLGNLRGELVTLQPALSDYAAGGYLIEGIGGATESVGNVGLDKVLFVIPVGGQGGYAPVWNPGTSKLQVWDGGSSGYPGNEVPANTNLSGYSFLLLLAGL